MMWGGAVLSSKNDESISEAGLEGWGCVVVGTNIWKRNQRDNWGGVSRNKSRKDL